MLQLFAGPVGRDNSVTFSRDRKTVLWELGEIGRISAEQSFALTSKSSNLSDGFEDINCNIYVNSVNSCDLWLKEIFGHGNKPKFIVYLGTIDLRCLILL